MNGMIRPEEVWGRRASEYAVFTPHDRRPKWFFVLTDLYTPTVASIIYDACRELYPKNIDRCPIALKLIDERLSITELLRKLYTSFKLLNPEDAKEYTKYILKFTVAVVADLLRRKLSEYGVRRQVPVELIAVKMVERGLVSPTAVKCVAAVLAGREKPRACDKRVYTEVVEGVIPGR